MNKFFSLVATAAFAVVAALALTAPASAAGSWSVVAAFDSSDVTVLHAMGGKEGGAITVIGESKGVDVVGIQTNDSKYALQGTLVYGSKNVDVTTYQGAKNNVAGTAVIESQNVSVDTTQTSNNNLSAVGVDNSKNVEIDVIQGDLIVSSSI